MVVQFCNANLNWQYAQYNEFLDSNLSALQYVVNRRSRSEILICSKDKIELKTCILIFRLCVGKLYFCWVLNKTSITNFKLEVALIRIISTHSFL